MTPGAGLSRPVGWFHKGPGGSELPGSEAPLPGVRWGEPLPSADERRRRVLALLLS